MSNVKYLPPKSFKPTIKLLQIIQVMGHSVEVSSRLDPLHFIRIVNNVYQFGKIE